MKQILVVTIPFGDYKIGDRIEDPATVARILEGHNKSHVVATQVALDSRFSVKE